ncbi:MAG: hypothetical protein JNG89_02830 [Planctomycetaceae bacterium]|nr:hypothetical protein [Planctomycetaceae bacterium]
MNRTLLALALIAASGVPCIADDPLRIATFNVDASPPIGSPLAYDPTREVTTPLTCRGVVLLGSEAPIVLCAVDWIGIGNDGHREFRERLAEAAGTTAERVAVHALHQHDAPWCDFSMDELCAADGTSRRFMDPAFAREVIRRASTAIREALVVPFTVTDIALSSGVVEKVASNRRILGPDGKVAHVRWTATEDPAVRAYPEGTIDPLVKMITFYRDEQPLVALTYYATHPQSYYRTGQATPDFPGLARNARQEATGVLHVHFCGASGNIGAGKYNDGAHKNRQVLADRMAAGMELAWRNAARTPITAAEVGWTSVPVSLPPATYLDESKLTATVGDSTQAPQTRFYAAGWLAWLRRCQAGDTIDVGCLTLGNARVLHMPGELFVEYQLAAQELRPDLFVCMAAYGDYAPWYIGTDIAYDEGGYETSEGASLVGPGSEEALVGAMRTLLDAENVPLAPLGAAAHDREVRALGNP